MNVELFKNWLEKNGKNQRVAANAISRLKTLQRELSIDLDSEYQKNQCKTILAALSNKGQNEVMESYGDVNLPIGKYSLSAYRYALKHYIDFKKSA